MVSMIVTVDSGDAGGLDVAIPAPVEEAGRLGTGETTTVETEGAADDTGLEVAIPAAVEVAAGVETGKVRVSPVSGQ
jgi:hypothetical protein